MSESPASLITITPTLYILPQAVPKDSIMRQNRSLFLTELNVVSVEVVNLGLGKHGVVFKFCSSNGGAVVSNNDELWLTLSERLDGWLVTYTRVIWDGNDAYQAWTCRTWWPRQSFGSCSLVISSKQRCSLLCSYDKRCLDLCHLLTFFYLIYNNNDSSCHRFNQ